MSYPQGNFYPQGSFHPQSNFYPSGSIGYPQVGFAHGPTQFGQPGAFGQPTQFGQLPVGQFPTQLSNWGTAGPNNGMTNGALSTAALSLQPQHQLLLQLAQYHHWVAQQFTQLAALQGIQNPAGPYVGQFIPGQMAANFVPGITMH